MSAGKPPPLPRARSRGQVALLLNAAVCPGLGSWIAGHRAQGAVQFLLAGVGLVLVCVWFVTLASGLTRVMSEEVDPFDRVEFAIAGLALFAGAWLWGLLTSMRVRRRERGREGDARP